MTAAPTSISSLLPGAGFFGGSPSLALSVQVNQPATEIRLFIDSDQPTYLNLQSIQFTGENGKSIPYQKEWRETMSSSALTGAPTALTCGRGIHSKEEQNPWWQVRFGGRVHVSDIKVANRRDTWGRRSRNLVIEVIDADSRSRVVYRNKNADYVTSTLLALARYGILQPANKANSANELRLEWIAGLVGAALAGRLSIEDIDWTLILSLIPIWERRALSDSEMKLVALFLLEQLRRADDFAFAYFSAPLYSVEQLTRLASHVNAVAETLDRGRFMFTRHGLQKEGRLRANRDRFLKATSRVIAILDRHGLRPSLAYGTLLGAVRDGDFIAHDDDVDLLCEVDAKDFDSARRRMESIMEILSTHGCACTFSAANALNVHVQCLDDGALIDLFPYWKQGDEAHLHMEKMAIRGIPADIVAERAVVRLCDIEFPAFKAWSDFLTHRYGANWMTPQIYFEWPWALSEEGK